MKAILNAKTVNAYIELHKKMRIPFTITMSNYTTRIKSTLYDIHFMKSVQSNRVFAAYNMVKADVKKKPLPHVVIQNVEYFSEAFMPHDFYSDVLFNFDMKSAYATILHNEGFITTATFRHINKLPKQDRLTVVGMLAGKKNIFQIDADGEVESEETVISDTANYFFYCVRRTFEIIRGAARILGDGFLFSWVDGIYFLENPESAEASAKIIIEHYFKEKGFLVTFETLTEFNVVVKKDFFHCTYRKYNKEKDEHELKIMNVPKKENKALKKITDFLLNKTNYERNTKNDA